MGPKGEPGDPGKILLQTPPPFTPPPPVPGPPGPQGARGPKGDQGVPVI